jgi:hypothetical protein
MRACLLTCVLSLAALQGCASEVMSEVGALSAPLATCEGRTEELRGFAARVRLQANDALSLHNQDPEGELAVAYFGPNHNQDTVRSILRRIVMIGGASESLLRFECLPVEDPSCNPPGEPALWVNSSDWEDSSWTIRVCGGRFWDDDYVHGTDSGMDASQVGVMAHELSHLGGAYYDTVRGEDAIKGLAASTNPVEDGLSEIMGDAYRFYIMKTPF